MIENLGRALRRTAGGSAIFVFGVGAVSSQPHQAVVTTGSALTLAGPYKAAPPSAGSELIWAPDERAVLMAYRAESRAAIAVAQPVAVKRPAVAVGPRTLAAHVAVAAITPQPAPPADPVAAAPGNSAGYAFGYCTWWVSHKRMIPWHGMAAQWWSLARSYGFAEGSTPRPGAVMVMGYGMAGASASSGHVAYVESVNPNGSFVISEMNWWGVAGGGWGKVDYRTISSMAGILGFIY